MQFVKKPVFIIAAAVFAVVLMGVLLPVTQAAPAVQVKQTSIPLSGQDIADDPQLQQALRHQSQSVDQSQTNQPQSSITNQLQPTTGP